METSKKMKFYMQIFTSNNDMLKLVKIIRGKTFT